MSFFLLKTTRWWMRKECSAKISTDIPGSVGNRHFGTDGIPKGSTTNTHSKLKQARASICFPHACCICLSCHFYSINSFKLLSLPTTQCLFKFPNFMMLLIVSIDCMEEAVQKSPKHFERGGRGGRGSPVIRQ